MQSIANIPGLKVTEDRWLAEVLRCSVYKIDPVSSRFTTEDLTQVYSDTLDSDRHALFYAKVDAEQVDQLNVFQATGMRVVDVNVTLERVAIETDFSQSGSVDIHRKIKIAGHTAGDHAALSAIAKNSFSYSRFHSDPLIENQFADRTREAWLASYLAGTRGDYLLVATLNNRVAGFLAAMFIPDRRVAVIDLMAVDPVCRGEGVGLRLVRAFVDHYDGRCDAFRVGSQIANQPALRLYAKCGFEAKHAAYVMHKHVFVD